MYRMQHLRDNCTTYTEHFLFSCTLGFLFLKAAGASFLHALMPSTCQTYATETVKDVSARLKAFGCSKA